MSDTEEQDVHIDADNVYVNNAWTPRAVFWNTIGTLIGGAAGLVALVIVLMDKF